MKPLTNRLKKTIQLIALFFYASTYCQQAVIPAGGTIQGSTGNVSYSIGQVSYTTDSNSTFSIAEGVQQPFEISVLDSDHSYDAIQLNVYPNPTSSVLLLDISAMDTTGLSYLLFDSSGKIIRKEETISVSQTTITLENLPSSAYYLELLANNKHLKTFKIIKN